MTTVSEVNFTLVLQGGGEHLVRLKSAANPAAHEDDEEVDLDMEDTILEWHVYLGREYMGRAQGTLVEAMTMAYSYVHERLAAPQRYLQAKAEMRLDDTEEAEVPASEQLFM